MLANSPEVRDREMAGSRGLAQRVDTPEVNPPVSSYWFASSASALSGSPVSRPLTLGIVEVGCDSCVSQPIRTGTAGTYST